METSKRTLRKSRKVLNIHLATPTGFEPATF
jgi:hypothetical protein